jgi:hypothetical protein
MWKHCRLSHLEKSCCCWHLAARARNLSNQVVSIVINNEDKGNQLEGFCTILCKRFQK